MCQQGCEGIPMPQGQSAYLYVAYADDNTGTGFSLTDPNHDYIAVLNSIVPLSPPLVSNFSGLWHKWTGDDGINGAISREWFFSTNTATSDPTATFLKLNNANATLATQLNISETDVESVNVATLLALSTVSTSTTKSRIQITKKGDNSVFALYDVTARVDNGAWQTITVAYVNGSSTNPFAANDQLVMSISVSGDAGPAGDTGIIILINDLTQQESNTLVGTDTITWNIPANTMVNDGDVCEFEAEIELQIPVNPVTADSVVVRTVNNGSNHAYMADPNTPLNICVKAKMSVNRIDATNSQETQGLYHQISGIREFAALNAAANFTAVIPLSIRFDNNVTVGSAPVAIIRRMILKYIPKV